MSGQGLHKFWIYMALALLDSFGLEESATDDLELEVLPDRDDLVDSFDDLPFELLLDDFNFLLYYSSATFNQFSSSFDCSSGFKIFQCSLCFFIISLKV